MAVEWALAGISDCLTSANSKPPKVGERLGVGSSLRAALLQDSVAAERGNRLFLPWSVQRAAGWCESPSRPSSSVPGSEKSPQEQGVARGGRGGLTERRESANVCPPPIL